MPPPETHRELFREYGAELYKPGSEEFYMFMQSQSLPDADIPLDNKLLRTRKLYRSDSWRLHSDAFDIGFLCRLNEKTKPWSRIFLHDVADAILHTKLIDPMVDELVGSNGFLNELGQDGKDIGHAAFESQMGKIERERKPYLLQEQTEIFNTSLRRIDDFARIMANYYNIPFIYARKGLILSIRFEDYIMRKNGVVEKWFIRAKARKNAERKNKIKRNRNYKKALKYFDSALSYVESTPIEYVPTGFASVIDLIGDYIPWSPATMSDIESVTCEAFDLLKKRKDKYLSRINPKLRYFAMHKV